MHYLINTMHIPPNTLYPTITYYVKNTSIDSNACLNKMSYVFTT